MGTKDIIFNRYEKRPGLAGLIPNFLMEKRNYLSYRKYVNGYAKQMGDEEKQPIFELIELETVNRCNSGCSFCPVNKKADTREYHLMSDELFRKIIDELAELDYSFRLGLYSNNEPFLDEKIIERTKYAREKLPNAFLEIYTNGTLLTLDKFLAIMPYLDSLKIDNYQQQLKLHKSVQEIYDYCAANDVYGDKLRIYPRKIDEVLSTRGGASPNKKTKKTLDANCILPFKQLVIRPDGKVSLCCSDALGQMTLGDLTRESLMEVWNGPAYRGIRKRLKDAGRAGIRLCKDCDMTIYYKS
ncbi:MAG: SPASM domain-containing protein [Lachnospiraceae bacterium]|nr:SPASM domain-containing protein [Lachnospiraceae bacterium]